MFRYTFTLIAVLSVQIFFTGCNSDPVFKGKFSFYPEKPKPGESVTVMYLPDSTNLKSADSVEMIIHLFSNELDSTISVEMVREGNGWKAEFSSDGRQYGALLKFKSGKFLDNNEKAGYFINFYQPNGNYIPGTLAGMALSVSTWGAFYADLERNREKAFDFFEEEFKTNPQMIRNFISPYLLNTVTLFPEKSDSLYNTLAKKTENNTDLNEKEINLLITYYGMNKYYDQSKVDQYTQLMKDKFPKGDYMQNDLINKIRSEISIEKKVELVSEFQEKFPESKLITVPYDITVNAFRDIKNYEGAYSFILENSSKVSPLRFYYLVSRMIEEKIEPEIALKVSELGINEARKNLTVNSSSRESYETEKDAFESRKSALAYSLFAKGKVLSSLGKSRDALKAFEEMISVSEGENPEMNEAFVAALAANEEFAIAKEKIESFLRSGTHTPPMKDLLKTAFQKINGSETGFAEYISEFESLAKDALINRLENEIIIKPAPDFSLADLDGNTVRLEDFRGKIVIVDFWATWCGPCLASFPGMKQAVEKYKNDENVKFLFVNSWERTSDKITNAKEFIAKNKYPFHVLMDEENKVITSYKVSGIPTKFIIDKDQNIRFISIGYDGTPEGLVEELSAMIAMLN